jgi:hypothetical protein
MASKAGNRNTAQIDGGQSLQDHGQNDANGFEYLVVLEELFFATEHVPPPESEDNEGGQESDKYRNTAPNTKPNDPFSPDVKRVSNLSKKNVDDDDL